MEIHLASLKGSYSCWGLTGITMVGWDTYSINASTATKATKCLSGTCNPAYIHCKINAAHFLVAAQKLYWFPRLPGNPDKGPSDLDLIKCWELFSFSEVVWLGLGVCCMVSKSCTFLICTPTVVALKQAGLALFHTDTCVHTTYINCKLMTIFP